MITRSKIKLKANSDRVILQFFDIGQSRSKRVIDRILSLDKNKVYKILNKVFNDFEKRHFSFEENLFQNFKKAQKYLPKGIRITNEQKLLIASYFSKEYSIEAAALFNPSIVVHPYQSNESSEELKFVMSLRATGEGHISSIEFREGIVDKKGKIILNSTNNFTALPYKISFSKKTEIDKKQLNNFLSQSETENFLSSNYFCEFSKDIPLGNKVIFPISKSESMGMEDVRLVNFSDKNTNKYYGTYTAYNGKSFRPQLIETKDFIKFKISTLHGRAVYDKGLALFPRKINGKYVFTSRQDGENLYLMYSDNLYYWKNKQVLKTPNYYWEFIQVGNCGSPIETEKGWLLITHAVGPFRKYVMSAILLDINNPSKIIGVLNEPLIEANENERDGYVPNVVYSCGSLIYNKNLIIPYAMSDSSTGFASVELKKILTKMNEV